MRGIERRLQAGLDPKVRSVASLFISRWDVAIKQEISPALHNRLGIAIAMRTYKAYRDLLASPRWQKIAQAGAQPQRLLWQRPTPSTLGRWRNPTPSTRYLRKHCKPLPTTVRQMLFCQPTEALRRQCCKNSSGRESTTMRWRHACSARAPKLSPSLGRRCWRASSKRARSLGELAYDWCRCRIASVSVAF